MGNQFNQGVQPSQAAFNAANPFMTHSNIAQPPQQPAHNSLDQVFTYLSIHISYLFFYISLHTLIFFLAKYRNG